MDLSVILPCYNAADTVGVQLEALARQRWSKPWGVEVIFVDNGSTDDSLKVAKRYAAHLPHFQVVDASARRGRPQARNAGARVASGDVLLFCDADDEVAPGWLAAMGEALAMHDFVACRFDTVKLNPPWLQRSLGRPQHDCLQRLWYPPYLSHAGGSSLGIRRAVHEAVGGFNESMPFLEDTEYCVRVQQHLRKELHFVPEATVHIRYRLSLLALYGEAYHWAQYNEFLFKRYYRADMAEGWRWSRYRADWMELFRNVTHYLRHKEGRVQVCWRVGWNLGLLKGSLQYRVPPASC